MPVTLRASAKDKAKIRYVPQHTVGTPVFCACAAVLLMLLSGCASVPGPPAAEPERHTFQRGHASWYGKPFHGRKTASGETFDMHKLTAAHRTLKFGTEVNVINLSNNRQVRVRITDRGPFIKGRIIDLSFAAAKRIGMVEQGTAQVELQLAHSDASQDSDRQSEHARQTGAAPKRKGYVVQIGAFSDKSGAQELAQKTRGKFASTRVLRDGALYRVFVGVGLNREQAEQLAKRLRKAGQSTYIRQH